jgi:zinc protease
MKRVLVLLLLAGIARADQPPQPAKPAQKGPQVAPKPVEPEPDPWKGRTDLLVPPKMTPTLQVQLGPIERFTLPNGLAVRVVARPTVPVVDVALAIQAGHGEDPIDRAGVAQFTASMLRKGTQKRTADQISDAVDSVGADFGAAASDDETVVGCHARAKELPLCLELTADAVEHATFPESEMKEIRDQLEASVEQAKDNPNALAAQHAENLFFGDDDPRGRQLSKASLAKIDRAQLVAFAKTWYAPNHALLTIAGDVDAKALRKQLTTAFGGWKKRPVPKVVERGLPAAGPLRVRLVDKPDATQSTIVILGPGIAHRSPEYYAVRSMAFALGAGGFSSRLMKVVRSEGGKTYGARLHYDAGLWPGPFVASTFTRTSETASTLKLVVDTIEKMRKEGPTADELAAAKGNLIGGYGLRLETANELARALLGAELDRMDPKSVEEFPARMNAVTLADAAKAAAAHLQPTVLTVVGPAADVRPQLEKAGYKIDELVNYAEPVSAAERRAEEAARQKKGDVSTAEAETAKKLLDLALQAKGAALLKVTDIALTGKGTMTMQGQTLPIQVQEFQVPGKAARQDISMGPMKMVQIFADGKATVRQGERVVELPSQVARKMESGLIRDPNFILRYAADGKVKVRGLQPVTDGGVEYDALEVIAGDGETTRVLLDRKTHLIARLEYKEEGKPTAQTFGDYRPEGGIAIPHAVSQTGEAGDMKVTYDKVEINKGLAPTTFKP